MGLFLNIWVVRGKKSIWELNLGWKQLVFRGIWVLGMVLVGYGSNDNRLRVWEKVDWMVYHSDCRYLHQGLLPPTHDVISDKGSVIVSLVIKTVSILTRVPSSLIPWCSLNWLNGWGGENIFGVDCWDGSTQK